MKQENSNSRLGAVVEGAVDIGPSVSAVSISASSSKDLSMRFSFVEKAGKDLKEVYAALERSVGKEKAEQFLSGLRDSLISPDKEIKQGGTPNCWFVDRMADLASRDPDRFAGIMLDAALNGEIREDYFAPEEEEHLKRGFGSRTTFQRISQRWYLDKMGVDEGIATEDLMKKSDKYLLGRDQIVLATDKYNQSSGVNIKALMQNHSELLEGAGVVLHWADANVDGKELHAYHRVVITKIENGQVFFREGVKSGSMHAPEGFQLRRMPDGSIFGSLPREVFEQRVVGLVVDKEKAENLGLKESYYNRDITFYPWQIGLDLKKVEPYIPKEDSEYYRYLRKRRKDEEEAVLPGSPPRLFCQRGEKALTSAHIKDVTPIKRDA